MANAPSTGAARARDYLKRQEKRAKHATLEGLPYWATVAAVSGKTVAITAKGAATAGTELIAHTYGLVNVGDDGICIPMAGGGLVFSRVAAGPNVGSDLILPVNVPGLTLATTTNTGTYITQITTTPSIPNGVWGCVITATGTIWRSVATGEMRLQLQVGGAPADERIYGSASGLALTNPLTPSLQVVRSDSVNPITITGPGQLTITLSFRGGIIAGNTNILNASIGGFLYRIS